MKKKIWFLFSIACLFLTYSKAQTQSPAIFPVMQNGKTGFIDKTGKLVVPCQYDPIDYFTIPRFAGGIIPFQQNGSWGALDATGKVAINPIYAEKLYFSESGYAYAKVKSGGANTNPYATAAQAAIIIDKKGNRVLPAEYKISAFVGGISGEILIYLKDKQYSIVNIRTKQESTKTFTSIKAFRNGFAVAEGESKGKYGLIDEKGNWVIQPLYYDLNIEDNGLFLASIEAKDAKWAIIDKSGKITAGPFSQYKKYLSMSGGSSFSKEGLMPIQDIATGLYGFMDNKGKIVIPCTYNTQAFFEEGIAMVNSGGIKETDRFGNFTFKNAVWKAIDASGKLLFNLPTGFRIASGFREGRCVITDGDKTGIIDTKGKFIVPAQAKISIGGYFNGLCVYENEKGIGYYDLNGKVVWEASK
jgi:DNA-binding transcriptional regulator/RsmH inhibitor MraZ